MDTTCPTYKCMVEDCTFWHPRLCKFFTQFGRCKFGSQCSYLHPVEKSSDDEIKALKQEIQILGLKIEEMENVALRLNHLEEIIESLCFVMEKHSSEVCDDETQENPEESRKEFKCDLCMYETTSQKGLNIHKGAKHKKVKAIQNSSNSNFKSTTSDVHQK